MMRRSVWQLGHVIPRLLVAVCLADIVLRFVSIDPFTFRAWEPLTSYRALGAAFEANRRYYNERSYGDLAALGNLPALRQYRTERFTTDALGFRNAAGIMDAEVSAILVGDSFAVGAGVSDDETLSSRLSNFGDCVVYNAGTDSGGVVPDRILAVAHSLHMRSRLVIRLYAEDADVPALPTSLTMLARKLVARTPAEVRVLVGRLRGRLAGSPLRILSQRALKVLTNDSILPNNYASNVVRATLHNGDVMLFLGSQVNNFYRRREVASDYWRWLQDELQNARFDLLVVLVPSKYTVYRPFLIEEKPVGQGAGDYLARLENELRAAGVPVLNLTPFLSAEASSHLQRGEYLYWLDDLHWNARGIALAAAAIRNAWPLTEGSCGTRGTPIVQKP